ncbi:MAG: diadenylate cyclase CdaA [Sphaerochaetaceae bacterium]|jgi:diadenylate cyclase|nr:diadenylate cyclase CdaA [Sphaerochaetaceae bacterium]MDD2404961.1 diadenylate cyclase CdaA [Sphaerochaetaceae bacterium]MDD3671048.1 diadenylate cyclase CdaA [Sphaerochaetaceae bacterium]MDD4258300.1 diadenylate cyclase CdaA [Sphaerochaetaceae bacterium]MDD4762423.1 diadenylate cyclase CdaA [Sphaerochaetaceae bacterium]
MFVEVLAKIWSVLGPIIEIGLLSYVFYRFYMAVAQTKAQQIFKIVFILLTVYSIAYVARLNTLLWLFKHMAVPLVIFICVVYQPELRRAFTQMFSGRNRLFRMGVQTTAEQIDSILNACTVLVSKNRGALIVFIRHLGIKNIIDSGTKLNADLSSALILTVFDHDTPLHDGAMVIQGNKIVAAGCYLPLSEQTDIKKSFGTRHRAALGLAEESDAIVLVVSEETGAISLTYNANLYYDLDTATVKRMLIALLSYHDVTPQDIAEATTDETE